MWCLATGPQVVYNLSHVIPASCGNNQLVLPPPIVCKRCNSSFGKIEQVFANEPEFNFKAALLGVPNARTGKPFTHDRFGVFKALPPRQPGASRDFDANVNLNLHGGTRLEVVPRLTVNGINVPLPPVSVNISSRWLALYSRSVHKILFEWYAHHYYVTGQLPDRYDAPTNHRFTDLRRFVKRGQPMLTPRILVRWYEGTSNAMNFVIDGDSALLLTEMNLMGTHYVAALAEDNAVVKVALSHVAGQLPEPALIFAEDLLAIGTTGCSVRTTWKL
jgi:hypothetical protein